MKAVLCIVFLFIGKAVHFVLTFLINKIAPQGRGQDLYRILLRTI